MLRLATAGPSLHSQVKENPQAISAEGVIGSEVWVQSLYFLLDRHTAEVILKEELGALSEVKARKVNLAVNASTIHALFRKPSM
jgi:hypothetical protein